MRYFAAIVFLMVSACSTPIQKEFDSFKNDYGNYVKSVSDDKGKVTVSDMVFYNEVLSIAKRHHQSGYEKVFIMLRLEAFKKESGLSNQFDELEKKVADKDPSIFNDAETYEVNMKAESKCYEFGYTRNTPDYNKCVYDVKVKYIGLQMQQQQLMMQMMPRPAPLIIPTQTHTQTNTNCYPTGGGGFSCTTQ